MTDINTTVGRRLRHARQRCNVTQAELGAVMAKPLSQVAISYVESGTTRITVSLLYELCTLLGTTPAEMLRDL